MPRFTDLPDAELTLVTDVLTDMSGTDSCEEDYFALLGDPDFMPFADNGTVEDLSGVADLLEDFALEA